jgi:hypothetical protein
MGSVLESSYGFENSQDILGAYMSVFLIAYLLCCGLYLCQKTPKKEITEQLMDSEDNDSSFERVKQEGSFLSAKLFGGDMEHSYISGRGSWRREDREELETSDNRDGDTRIN